MDAEMDEATRATQPVRMQMIMESQGINDPAVAKAIDDAAFRVATRILSPLTEIVKQEAGPDVPMQMMVNLFALLCIEANAASAGMMMDMIIPCQCEGCAAERASGRTPTGATRH